jgi:2,4-dienoyl-CoA reductase-like NADH-dependent reductase (Old Yellow Enzyme family)/thioredoxin reductase
MTQQFTHLFSPIQVGNMTVPNRIVVPGHYPALRDPDSLPGERMIAYLESKAKGGAGMICTGIWAVHRSSPNTARMGFEFHQNQTTPLQLPGGIDRLKKAAERIQQYGAKFMVQLWHGGANAYGTTAYGHQLWAPSAVRAIGSGYVTHAMTKDEIKEVIEGFAAEAYRCKQAGVDGVEIHGAHGYLITQFMSPLTNLRTDEYGGDHAGRIRFACEIIDAVRAAVGRDFAIGIRISADLLGGARGYTLEDTKIYAQRLVESGNLDYIATGAGIPPMYYPLGSLMYHAAGIKEVVDIPVIGGGRITDPVQAEQILADHQADLLFMNRALICDPEMPRKAREGRLEEIRHCMGCSEGCWMRVAQDQNPQGVCCTYNPTVGKESLSGWLELIPAKRKKKVMVIGGGPAGLETARVAKSRGHDVSLWEKSDDLGGLTLLAAKPPGRDDFNELSRYYKHQMKLLNVEVHLGSEVTLETVEKQNPEVVVVATGSKPMIPWKDIPGIDQDNVIKSVREVLSGQAEVGQNVLIVDHQRHIEGLATADFLAQQQKKVEVIYPLDQAAANMERITKTVLRRRLAWGQVKLTPFTELKSISGDSVTVVDPGTDEERVLSGFDTIILSYGGVEDNDLYYLLKDKFPEVYAAGDCNGVRKTLWAVHDGAVIGRAI